MDDMFEITAGDIAALNDEDLRGLVALLCEAEMRLRGLPTSAVSWGGDQNAPDGGVDVRVDLPKTKKVEGFVPRLATGFQVKKSDMSRKEILKEMRPGGKVRPLIRNLIGQSGAYIIVSSNGSVTDSALRNRREAMADAIKGIKNAKAVLLDFYDRGRVATWLRDHPGLIPWVRQKTGRSLRGWRSYGAWANTSEDERAPYLLDDKLRVLTRKRESGGGVSSTEGLELIRAVLRDPRKVARIVGLSGVGKTRFVQALFDARVGERGLNPSLAIYTNMSDDPDPQPVGLASDLIASKSRAILIVDNCASDLHRRLSEACRAPGSLLSVVTVEYDIRDDDPEETDVFRLEPSSVDLIEKLIRARFKSVSQVDARTIASFSGGNARIGIALAGTIKKNESIAGLTDADLFGRLFEQRHGPDAALLLIAQACSLIYSFQGEATNGADAELATLAALTGKSVDEVFRGVAELKSRDLIQQRGVWRAVLPHAIANRLAEMALQNFPIDKIKVHLVESGSKRLLKSFSRRLSYLHENKVAVRIVEEWFGEDGLLSDVAKLDEFSMALFENVAPVAPEAVLSLLERTPLQTLPKNSVFEKTVRSIAFDPKFFERCATWLLDYGAVEKENPRGADPDRHFTSLFYLVFSGTHASLEQRIAIVELLLRSDDPRHLQVGIEALRSLLKTRHFDSSISFEFGARPRDYGSWPKTSADVTQWYISVLKLVETLVLSELPVAAEVPAALAGKFRELWSLNSVREALDQLCRKISETGFWRDGWTAVRQTLKYDSKGMEKTAHAKLNALEKALKPAGLLQDVRGVVLTRNSYGIDLDDFEDDDEENGVSRERVERIAAALGRDVARDKDVFHELLPELVKSQGRLWSFGRGLARGADEPTITWSSLVAAFAATPKEERNSQSLCGFIQGLGKRDLNLANRMLDEAVANEPLAEWLPELQCGLPLDKKALERLHQSLRLDRAPTWRFGNFAYGGAPDLVSGDDLKQLLIAIAAKSDGLDVAMDILDMRFFSDKQQKNATDPALVLAGRELVQLLEFANRQQNGDHRIGSIIETCLNDVAGANCAKAVCLKFRAALVGRKTYVHNHGHLLQSLFKAQPIVALNVFFSGSASNQKRGIEMLLDVSRHDTNPLDSIPSEELFAWCDLKPQERYPLMAQVVSLYAKNQDEPAAGWSVTALALLEKSPDSVEILERFVGRFRPISWSGSRAVAMEGYLPLLQTLQSHADRRIAQFAKAEEGRLRKEIDKERRQETRDDKVSDERFE
jgi:hypothetical protein